MTAPEPVAPRTRVLVGVDGSDDSLRAVRYAMHEALKSDQDLWLVNAVDDGGLGGGWGLAFDPTILEDAGRQVVEDARQHVIAAGFPADRVYGDVQIGHPTSVLAALSGDASMVVVGRRAASGLERMFVGSTSMSLAAAARCPLIVISAATVPSMTGGIKRIAVAVENVDKASSALAWGFAEAARRDARLVVIHVVPSEPPAAPQPDENAPWIVTAASALNAAVEPLRLANPGVEVETQVYVGRPIEELVAGTTKVDLLILGLNVHPVTGLLFSGVVRAVVANALCPVGLVRS